MKIMKALTIFPVNDMDKTADFYVDKLGFRCVKYLDAAEPHVCLYRDAIEIVLTKAEGEVVPNRIKYGYGEDAYFITAEQERLQEEFKAKGVTFAKEIEMTDYGNKEFIIRDIDGRQLVFGMKQWNEVDENKQWDEMYSRAKHVHNDRRISDTMEAGCVSAAIMTASGNIYVGVCIDMGSSLGMCAERNALANMITNGESEIRKVLAIMPDGSCGAPCGACREFMMQLGVDPKEIKIMLDYDTKRIVTLEELCPDWPK
jgi:cytidine deaminase